MKKLTLLIAGLSLAVSGFAQIAQRQNRATTAPAAKEAKTAEQKAAASAKRKAAKQRAAKSPKAIEAAKQAKKRAQRASASAKAKAEKEEAKRKARLESIEKRKKKRLTAAAAKAIRTAKKAKAAKPTSTAAQKRAGRKPANNKTRTAQKTTKARNDGPGTRNKTIGSGTAEATRTNAHVVQRNIVTSERLTRDDGELVTLGIGWKNQDQHREHNFGRSNYYKKRKIIIDALIPGVEEAMAAVTNANKGGKTKGTAEYTLKQDVTQQNVLVSKFADDILFYIGELRVELGGRPFVESKGFVQPEE